MQYQRRQQVDVGKPKVDESHTSGINNTDS